jgi:hypothetical protein
MPRKLRFLIVLSCTAPAWTLGASVSVTRDPDCSPNACGSVIQQNGAQPAGSTATLLWYFNGIAYPRIRQGTGGAATALPARWPLAIPASDPCRGRLAPPVVTLSRGTALPSKVRSLRH